MTTINTIEDLIRVLDENPLWVDALRVRLLTRELIELPETFAKFAEVVNQRLTKLETGVEGLKVDVAGLRDDVGGLKVDVAGLRDDVGHLKGWSLESQIHSRIVPLISQALDVRRAEIMRSPVQEMRSELRDTVEDSADSQLISAEQERRVIVTDFVLKARRRGTASPLWVAVEVSSKIRSEDIVRALETAHILATMFGEDSAPVVAGYSIDPQDQQLADESGVVVLEVSEDWG